MQHLMAFRNVLTASTAVLLLAACERPRPDAPDADSLAAATAAPQPAPPMTYASYNRIEIPVTLPVLDAFLADSTFLAQVRTRLALTEQQVDSLRQVAREETARLDESSADDYAGSTIAATELAASRINAVLGQQKATDLMALVRYYWSDAASIGGDSLTSRPAGDSTRFRPNLVPSDTRIVVNAPAYRMDLFQDGKLVRTYKVAIGYPEFPLPVGTRTAEKISFNPTWTPPDEPWVEGSTKAKVGVTVPAGSKLNPLGIAKIPIGLPSLIHGGKALAQLGGFGSHGCVGLTDAQMREFSVRLATIAGGELDAAQVRTFGQNRKETRDVALARPIPVELRYETIVLQDGALHILRDVYAYGTNTEDRLQAVLAAHGATIEQLTPEERAKVTDALRAMSASPAASPAAAMTDSGARRAADSGARPRADSARRVAAASDSLTRTVKGPKSVVIPVAALGGKGYPAPVTN